MGEDKMAVQPQTFSPKMRRAAQWRRFRHELWMARYSIPGYGKAKGSAYRTFQQAIHARGRCILRRDLILHQDGRQTWRCTWCGHMSTDSAHQVRVNRARAGGDHAEVERLQAERAREIGAQIRADRPEVGG